MVGKKHNLYISYAHGGGIQNYAAKAQIIRLSLVEIMYHILRINQKGILKKFGNQDVISTLELFEKRMPTKFLDITESSSMSELFHFPIIGWSIKENSN